MRCLRPRGNLLLNFFDGGLLIGFVLRAGHALRQRAQERDRVEKRRGRLQLRAAADLNLGRHQPQPRVFDLQIFWA